MVTQLALIEFVVTMPDLNTQGIDNNIAPQLTSEMLQEHFEVTKPRLRPNMVSVEFKQMVLALQIKKMLPDIISLIASFLENSPKLLLGKELDKNIQMLRRCFNNDETNKEVLTSWLMSTEMEKIRARLNNAQIIEINNIGKIYSHTNIRKVSDMRKMLHKRALVASSVAGLTWKHNSTRGLIDSTPVDSAKNSFQFAL
jgi:hypothetical protein